MKTETTTDRSPEMTAFLRWLRSHDACDEGIALVRQHPTPEAWWAASERGDHMLWLCGYAGIRRQVLTLAACPCARLALPYVTPGEARPLRAIETAEREARGEAGVTMADVRAAAADASAAAASSAYAANAAYAAAYAGAAAAAETPWVFAASAANAAASAANAYAADAANAAASSAYAADDADDADASAAAASSAYAANAAYAAAYAADDARTRILRQCADIVRERIPWSMVAAAMETKS